MARFTKILWLWLALLASAATQAGDQTILVLGDSLSAGYGLNRGEGWVALLERRLKDQGYPQKVVNASVSGDTTAGGLSRLPAALAAHRPQWVLIELGANDGLRGQPLAQMRSNLDRLVALSRKSGARPMLFEMRIPNNYGAAYVSSFHRSFSEIARAQKLPLVPFFLAAIATDAEQFQDDGLHPNALAQPKLLEAVWATLKPQLQAAKSGKAS